MMADFTNFREKLLTQFYQLNADFKKKAYDRCLDCWVSKLYLEQGDVNEGYQIYQFLLFVRADLTLY